MYSTHTHIFFSSFLSFYLCPLFNVQCCEYSMLNSLLKCHCFGFCWTLCENISRWHRLMRNKTAQANKVIGRRNYNFINVLKKGKRENLIFNIIQFHLILFHVYFSALCLILLTFSFYIVHLLFFSINLSLSYFHSLFNSQLFVRRISMLWGFRSKRYLFVLRDCSEIKFPK